MNECLDSLGDGTVFVTLDCSSSNWQIPVSAEDVPKTTSTCLVGAYFFSRMPFVLLNAPATSQPMLDILLARYRRRRRLIYSDDIIVFLKDVNTHMRDVTKMLTALKGVGLSLRLRKRRFFRPDIKYLVHMVKPGEVLIGAKKLSALAEASPPRAKTRLRSILCIADVFGRSVNCFAKVSGHASQPFKKKTRDTLTFSSNEQLAYFEAPEESLVFPSASKLPRLGLRYSLDTDD